MTTKIKWRLANRPTPDEITLLFGQGLLTKEEAREILFSLETDEDRDKSGLQEEIKFLRELVKGMADNRSQIVTTIREVQKPYLQYPWWQQYQVYCNAPQWTSQLHGAQGLSNSSGITNAMYAAQSGTSNTMMYTAHPDPEPDFTSIKTF